MPKLVPHEPSNGSQVAPPDAEWRPVDDPPPPSSSQKLDELMPVIRDYGSSLKTSVFLSLEGPLKLIAIVSLLPALAWFVASLWVRGLALFPDPFGGPAWIQKLGLAGGAGIAVAFAMAKLSAWVDDHI